MADISKITITDGTTYNIKDSVARREPIDTRTYTDIIATSDANRYASFFYLRIRPTSFTERWSVSVRLHVTVPADATNSNLYVTDTSCEVWASGNAIGGYYNVNRLTNASYKPISQHSVFFASETGYNNGCSHWLGVNLYSSTTPLDAAYKRTVVVELLDYDNCEVEFQNTLYTPDTIPNRSAHTAWYTSTTTSFTQCDAASQGVKMTGDANTNTTTIHQLYRYYGTHVMNSVLYRYQLMFHMDENTLTPLNNNSNTTGTTKTMLTEVEFDPFMPIYYYNTTTTVQAGSSVPATNTFFHYGGINLQYTLNIGSTLVAHKPIYLVVTPTASGKCKLASQTPWSQTLPSSNDGNWYILLGRTYSTYQFTLYAEHPVYMHNGTRVVRVSPYTSITEAEIDAICSNS